MEDDLLFIDRVDAGQRLAAELDDLRGEDVVVLGLPRGGVPVAFEVAAGLGAPLDVIVVRKLAVPFQPELGFGAIGEDGARIIDGRDVAAAGLGASEISAIETRERAELDRRVRRFRAGRSRVPLSGRTAVVVDDGIATGSTARAACQVARAQGVRRLVLAAPVGPPEVVASLRREADKVVCLHTPKMFAAISQWYAQFPQTSDEEVVALLKRATTRAADSDGPMGAAADASVLAVPDPPGFERDITVGNGDVQLAGHLTIPDRAAGMIIFAHGSGSSPRNRFVAAALNQAGLGTLLADLLTPEEELSRANVFDVRLLAARLAGITGWLGRHPAARGLPVGRGDAAEAALLRGTHRPRATVT
jgi:putative phosphoribosyl transferase